MLHETEATYINGHSYKTNGKVPQPITTNLVQELKEQNGEYSFEEIPTPPSVPPIRSLLGNITLLITWVCWAFYLQARLQQCRQSGIAGMFVGCRAWLLFSFELLLLSPDFLQAIELTLNLAPLKASQNRPSRRLVGFEAPLIHILVTTCGEDVEVIMDTVEAAACQDYPKQSYRVFALDDAKNIRMREAIEQFNTKAFDLGVQPVVYLARDKKPGQPHYYKAGNLSFGLETTRRDYGDSEYFAALDADCIPTQDWLSRTVPHMTDSPDLALVSPPQLLYNIPEPDAMAQDSSAFAHIFEPLRDRFNCSQCSGSGYIMRRSALDAIGGWPLVNIGEDILCSYLLIKEGWKTAFIQDEIQYGLAPDSFHAYISQRIRWTAGSLLSAKRFHFFLPFLDVSPHRTAVQRSFSILHAVKAYFNSALIVPILLLPLCFMSLAASPASLQENRRTTRGIYLFLWICSRVSKRLTFGQLGSKNLSNMSKNRYWTVPFNVLCIFRSWISDVEQTTFTVTGSFSSPVDERSATNRQPFWTRMRNPMTLMYSSYCVFAVTALSVWGVSAAMRTMHSSQGLYCYTALTLRLIDVAFAACVPVGYMACPPTVPPRRELLEKDEQGVYRSKKRGWTRRDGGLSWKNGLEVLVILTLDWL